MILFVGMIAVMSVTMVVRLVLMLVVLVPLGMFHKVPPKIACQVPVQSATLLILRTSACHIPRDSNVPFLLLILWMDDTKTFAESISIRQKIPTSINYSFEPVSLIPWMNVFWAKKNAMIIGTVKTTEAAIN